MLTGTVEPRSSKNPRLSRYNSRMTDPHRRQSLRPSAGQKIARGEPTARKNELARKKRTCELIQLGGVCVHNSFTSLGQVDELLGALSTRASLLERLRRRSVHVGSAE